MSSKRGDTAYLYDNYCSNSKHDLAPLYKELKEILKSLEGGF